MTRFAKLFATTFLLVLACGVFLRGALPQVSTGTFQSGAEMTEARSGGAAVTLDDGRVLVFGGSTASGATNAVQLFDPASNSWSDLGVVMLDARSGHSATALADGRILLAGGENSSGPISSLELYDPASNSFSSAGTLSGARKSHGAARLPDGRVLIIGGSDGTNSLASSEIYDSDSGSVSAGPSLSAPRSGSSVTALLDGKVLIAGGNDGAQDLASTEIYNPADGSVSAGASLSAPRSGHSAILLPHNNSVLIAGGSSAGSDFSSAELYIPWTSSVSATGSMSAARNGAAGSGLKQDGIAMVAGGSGSQSSELYGFATVKTDKDDYAPGEIVTITGSGWQPGETVTLLLHEAVEPPIHGDRMLTAVADTFGNIANNEFAPEDHDYGVRFYLTASGANSQAQTTFTDGQLQSNISFSIGPGSVSPGALLSWSAFATCQDSGGPNNCAPNGFVNGGPVANGYALIVQQDTNAGFPAPVTRATTATVGGSAGGVFSAPTSPGTYFYRARHPSPQTIGSNVWQPKNSNTVAVVVVDNVPPNTFITSSTVPAGGFTSSTSASFTFTGTDNVTPPASLTFQCSLDGAAFTACTSPTSYSLLSDGPHTFQVRARDAAGNLDASPASHSWTVDTSAPEITANVSGTAGTNGWYTSDVNVTWTVTDLGSGIASSTGCGPTTLTMETEGTTLTCSATNNAGASNSASVTIKIDKTGPTAALSVTAGTLGSNGWYTSDVTVDTDGTDSISSPVVCTADQFQTTETAGQVFNGSCTNDAGLSTNAAPLTIKLDKTGPSADLSVTVGTPGTNGWYTSDVTVHTSGSDAISDNVSCSADQFQTTETAGTVFNGSCTNDAGLTTNAAPLTVKLDKTGPSASLSVIAGTAGANGWYISDVTVDTDGTDSISNPTSCTADQVISTEGAAVAVDGSCTNDAGLTTPASTLYLKIDKTGPSASLAVTAGTPGANGWYISDVTVGTSGSDTVSNPTTCTADQFQTTETAGSVFNGSCTNDAGLATNADPLTVKLDKTGPSAALAVTAATLGNNGWYVSNVTISTSGTDSISNPTTCTADQFQTTDTTGTAFNGSCTNDAGLSTNAAPLTVKRDATAPTISIVAPANLGSYVLNAAVASDYSCSDATSLVAPGSCNGPVANGVNFSTNPIGGHSFTVTVMDNAGNSNSATNNYSILFSTGPCLGAPGHQILQPINPDGSSVFKQKSTVPAKFRVCDANGVSIGAPGTAANFRLIQIVSGTIIDTVDEAVDSTTPDQYFRWSSTDQQWIFNINTKGQQANKTYYYDITLADGSHILFNFGLK